MGTIPRDPLFYPRMKFRAEKRIMRQHFDHVHWAVTPRYALGGIVDPGLLMQNLSGSAERVFTQAEHLQRPMAAIAKWIDDNRDLLRDGREE